ncbi:MAG: LamG domain-containing protein [Candidatus Limnocylindrales bacterium]
MGNAAALKALVRLLRVVAALAAINGCAILPAGQPATPTPSVPIPATAAAPSLSASPTPGHCSLEAIQDEVGHGHTFSGAGFAPDVPLTLTIANADGSERFDETESPGLRSDIRGAFRIHLFAQRKDLGPATFLLSGGGCEAAVEFVVPPEFFPAAECDVLDSPADTGGQPADAYAAAVAADEPTYYWRFEEATGDSTSSSDGTSAPLMGSPVLGQGGIVDGSRAVLLDDDGDFVDIPDVVLDGDFTIEAWYRFCGNWMWFQDALFGQAGPGPNLNFYEWSAHLWDGRSDVVISSELLGREGWHHLAVTRSDGHVVMYQDGEKVGTGELPNSYPVKAIGAGELDDRGEGTFGGWMDEVAFYDHALSADRGAAHAAFVE